MNVLTAVAQWMAPRSKAIAAGAGSLVLQFLALSRDGMTGDDWTALVVVALSLAGITYAVPNRQPPTKH